jgi:hypothetical protein
MRSDLIILKYRVQVWVVRLIVTYSLFLGRIIMMAVSATLLLRILNEVRVSQTYWLMLMSTLDVDPPTLGS